MILNELVLHNFGVYGGRQAVPLAPPSMDKPIVLFGGLNGAGKTTLLDAIHLVLFGKRAQCSNRGTLGYRDFLRRCIHRQVATSDGTAIELEFLHRRDGTESTVRVVRSWAVNGRGLRERLDVLVDGQKDPVLTDSWEENVEEFFPLGIASLFLFDGDQIEALADLTNSEQVISTALRSLLGLDHVDQLITDLGVLIRRKRTELKAEPDRRKLAELEQQQRKAREQVEQAHQRRADLQNQVDKGERGLRKAEDRFRREGGELLEQLVVFEAKRAQLAASLDQAQETLRDLASDATPLLLLGDALTRLAATAGKEQAAREAALLHRVLTERDEEMMVVLRKATSAKKALSAVEGFCHQDRAQKAQAADEPTYLNISPDGAAALHTLQRTGIPDLEMRARKALAAEEQLCDSLANVDRQLAAVPDKEAVEELLAAREKAKATVDKARARLAAHDEFLAKLEREEEQIANKLKRELRETVDLEFLRDDANRVIAHSERVRTTMKEFGLRVRERHINRIEHLVLESFRHLLRKETLITDLTVDPRTFRLSLHTKGGQVLPPDRLSAGERQLLATSLLWGLAKAAGRPLPTVIDTPLGRLDSVHREHLVTRYFPHAGHQVLLLSTDEEINEAHLERLAPWIGRSYRLAFDDAQQATTVHPGYFWEGMETNDRQREAISAGA